jgi:hypothetical protein
MEILPTAPIRIAKQLEGMIKARPPAPEAILTMTTTQEVVQLLGTGQVSQNNY